MKIYIDLAKQAITNTTDEKVYEGDFYSNVFEVLFYNYEDTNWFPTMSQLAPNGREAGDFTADALGAGESHTYVEDGKTYLRFTFTMGATWVLMKGKSNFYIWLNRLNGTVLKKCVGMVNVMIDQSTDNYFIADPLFNPAVKTYINACVAEIGDGSPKYFDTAANIALLTEDKGLAVATDTGHLYYWNSTSTSATKYTDSGLVYNDLSAYYTKTQTDNTFAPKSTAITHTGNQLQDYSGNNIYPELDNYQVTTTKIASDSITLSKLYSGLQDILVKCATNYNVNSTPVAPFDDLNTLPKNSICTYAINASTQGVSNLPTGFTNGTIATYITTNVGVQIAYYRDGRIALRTYYGSYESWAYNITTSTGDISESNLNSSLSNKLIFGVSNFSSLPSAPFNDFDTFTINSIVAFAEGGNLVAHCPTGFRYGMVLTYSYSKASTIHTTQLVTSNSGEMWIRYKYGASWCDWKKIVTDGDKAIFENNPFSLSLFKNIAVIGDSYASGLLVDYNLGINENHYDCSWIQILARQYGITATNYSANGVNAKTWFTTNDCYNKFANDTAKDLYYVCLGINAETTDTGTTADIDLNDYTNNADTFYGNLGKIISMIKEKSPNGKIIVSTTPSNATKNADIIAIANYCSVPILRIDQDALISSSIYTTDFRSQGHPTLIGYSAYAKAYDRQTSKCIANNVSYFKYYKGVE